MPVVIREVGVIEYVSYSVRGKTFVRRSANRHVLDAEEPYPVTIAPTGYLVVPWGKYRPVGTRVRGYAIRGDGRRFLSPA